MDAVVFVAGTAAYGRTASVPPERERSIFELNCWACANAAKSAVEHWAENDRPGTFLAVLSIVARRAVPFEAHYSASKAAAARFLECLELEYGPRHIRVLSAFPGTLDTPFRRQAEWYGLAPGAPGPGADVRQTARALCALLDGTRRARVIGWRERAIDLADRLVPGLYDRMVLQKRVARMLKAVGRDVGPSGSSENENGQGSLSATQVQGQR
jgi:short-subunit dehydrogenase